MTLLGFIGFTSLMLTITVVTTYIGEKHRTGESYFFNIRKYLRERKELIDKQSK